MSATLRRMRELARVDADQRLLEDYTFSSPSTAANFVVGNCVNGLVEWCYGKRSLKQIKQGSEV